MDRVTAVLDRLLGLDAHAAAAMELAKQLQQSPNPRMKVFASNLFRHARGVQTTTATIRQELTNTGG